MSSRLVNVRLDEERLRKARLLREQGGLALSDVIREAIDDRFDRLNRSRKLGDIRNIVERIFEWYPDPSGLPPRSYNVQDRKAARTAITEKLGRRAP